MVASLAALAMGAKEPKKLDAQMLFGEGYTHMG